MVVKVGNINSVMFKGANPVTKPVCADFDEIKITELKKTVPDFNVQTPQKYSKLGITELENGLKIHSYKLANGHKVTIIPMEDSPTTVKNYVNVGSMNETDDIKGISHFLEHMAFNGTNGTQGYIKLNRGDSFKKIDELGGWTNASTNYAVTDYVNSTPLLDDKDLETQICVIAAMSEDLKLSSDMIEKEKFPVCSEIDMILDNPETVAIDQTVRGLFNIRSSADELVGGSVNHIQNLDRQKVLDYYNKYYTPDNMHLVITGDVDPDEVMSLVSKNFHSNKTSQGKKYDTKLTPIQNSVRKDFITDKTSSATIVMGFAGHKTNDIKSQMISDIVSNYISSTDFGIYEELEKLGAFISVGTEKISTNPNNPTFTYLTADCSDENSEKVLKLLFDKFSKMKIKDEEILNNIKKSMLMNYNDSLEFSSYLNNIVGNSTFNGDLDYIVNYKTILENITLDDVNNYIDKYLDLSKSAITVVHPETIKENIMNNYEAAKSISFQGKTKEPINMDKVSTTTLDNNYEVAFVETKNNNVPFSLNLYYDIPKDINPAAYMVLDSVLSKGTMNMKEKEFLKYMENNAMTVSADLSADNLYLYGYSSQDNFENTAIKALELLNNPRILDKEVEDSVKKLKDIFERYDKSASDLYEEYEAENNPYYHRIEEIREGLNTITTEDVQKLYQYIMENSKGIITVNLPEKSVDMKQRAEKEFSKFPGVKPFKYEPIQIYKENPNTVVLTESRNVSQAEIMESYKFKAPTDTKEKLALIMMNSILSSSDSIGLFNSLREKDHLAYRVNSSLCRNGDCGEINLYILTSTDNKDTGKTSYDNVKKSINGFNRQIGKLLNSEYKDTDLETAKRALKAEILDNETVFEKIGSISGALAIGKSLDYDNQRFDMIDAITREDIDNMAKKVFSGKPVYSIVASQDTIDYNKEFFDKITHQ